MGQPHDNAHGYSKKKLRFRGVSHGYGHRYLMVTITRRRSRISVTGLWCIFIFFFIYWKLLSWWPVPSPFSPSSGLLGGLSSSTVKRIDRYCYRYWQALYNIEWNSVKQHIRFYNRITDLILGNRIFEKLKLLTKKINTAPNGLENHFVQGWLKSSGRKARI